jgi:uncharacterized surface protein with fasciclin (FAS1) repeats
MKKTIKKLKYGSFVVIPALLLLSSCNKDLEQLPAIPTPVYPTGNQVAGTIAANVNDSLYNKIIVKSGMAATLNDSTKTFTMFIPDNNGMIASFGSPANALAAINSFSAATCAGIVSYNTVGQKFPSASLGTAFPNYPLTTLIILDPTQPFVRMPIFPLRGTTYSYVNNIPLTAVDMPAANGVIHHTGALVAPPSATLKTMIATESTLSYFRAAVARADSGQVGLSKFDSLMNYGATNMTILAPNDAAFQTLVFGLVYSQVLAATGSTAIATAQANAAVAAGPNFLLSNSVTTALVQGIVAYHFLASLTSSTTTPYQPNIRVFSVDVPPTPGTFVKTLVNGGIAAHPGILATATFTGPIATSISFKGYGTFPPGGTPFTYGGTTVAMDKHAVNGVYHIINTVLLPQ